MFMGPFAASQPWSTDGMVGSYRFIERVWRIGQVVLDQKNVTNETIKKSLHKTIKKISEDIVSFSFNTGISAMMILVNDIEKNNNQISVDDYKQFLKLLAPFAPHITEEIWEMLGEQGSIHLSDWPAYDPLLVVDDTVTLGVQVNGKVRAEIEIAVDESADSVQEKVLTIPEIIKWVGDAPVKKFIYVPKKIISIVI
jgi:leucyl-tRNA synthetase